jgi:hypothetical protein
MERPKISLALMQGLPRARPIRSASPACHGSKNGDGGREREQRTFNIAHTDHFTTRHDAMLPSFNNKSQRQKYGGRQAMARSRYMPGG